VADWRLIVESRELECLADLVALLKSFGAIVGADDGETRKQAHMRGTRKSSENWALRDLVRSAAARV
jgi:hypothetical protein